MITKPNLFLVGAMKAGTTAVAAALANHDEVYGCPIKEPNHFCLELHSANVGARTRQLRHFNIKTYLSATHLSQQHFAYVEDRADYEQLFREQGGQRYILDGSTTYLNSPFAAYQIKSYNPDARIIVITRDPVERAWSEFMMNVYIGVCDKNYMAALEREAIQLRRGETPLFERYVSTGHYKKLTAPYLQHFGTSNVFISRFERMINNPGAFMDELCEFLGFPIGSLSLTKENAQKQPRSAAINTLLHKSGIKNFLQSRIPDTYQKRILKVYYSNKRTPIPSDFRSRFEELFREFSE